MTSRRRILTTSAALGAAAILPACRSTPARRRIGPNERLDLGIIGVANRGAANLDGVAGENIVALCDVDESYLAEAGARFPAAQRFVDYRAMLAEARLDAVVISTPDHTHAPATLAALEAGLDVYCEKPLTFSVAEARAVAELAQKMRAVTQMGTQIHATSNYRRAVELVRSGVLGAVHTCHAWVEKAWGGGERPSATPPVPAGLHWDLWLGPARPRPYHPDYAPGNWRRWWEFGGGTLGDMGCHLIDLAFWALDLEHPTRVASEGLAPHAETAPLAMRARWEFPARTVADRRHGALTLHWSDGGLRPAPIEAGAIENWGMGVLFEGEHGSLLVDYDRWRLFPEERFHDFVAPPPTIAESIGHYAEWIAACKSRGPTTCSFDYAGPLTETVLLGNVAFRAGAAFDWDSAHLRASTSEATRFLARERWS